MGKVYNGFRPKRHKNPTRWGGTSLYSLYKGVFTLSVPIDDEQTKEDCKITEQKDATAKVTMFSF